MKPAEKKRVTDKLRSARGGRVALADLLSTALKGRKQHDKQNLKPR